MLLVVVSHLIVNSLICREAAIPVDSEIGSVSHCHFHQLHQSSAQYLYGFIPAGGGDAARY